MAGDAPTHDVFVITDDDQLLVDFTTIEEPAIRAGARGVIHLMAEIWRFLERPTTRQQAQRTILTLQLAKICSDYISEIERCKDAYFAQSVLCCSLVETLLMLVCLKEREQVAKSRSWRRFLSRKAKGGRLVHEVLPSVELGTLIDIGEELGWFAVSEDRLEPFTHLEEWNLSSGYRGAAPLEMVRRLQHFRNGIHPGKALREKFNFDEESNKSTLWLAFMSLAGVLVYAQEDTPLTMKLQIDPRIRAALQHETPTMNAIQGGLLLGVAATFLPNEEVDDDISPKLSM